MGFSEHPCLTERSGQLILSGPQEPRKRPCVSVCAGWAAPAAVQGR